MRIPSERMILPNSKSEYRAKRPPRTNPKQIQNSNFQMTQRGFGSKLSFEFWSFDIVSSFEFRASDFGPLVFTKQRDKFKLVYIDQTFVGDLQLRDDRQR